MNMLDHFDSSLLRYFLSNYVDCASLARFACTCRTFNKIVLFKDESNYKELCVVDKMLDTIAPHLSLRPLGAIRLRYVSYLRAVMKSMYTPKLSCGRAHTAFIARSGNEIPTLFTFGTGKSGELGTGDKSSYDSPQVVPINSNDAIVAVSCGFSHTCVLTESGQVYGFGLNKNGQLGNAKEIISEPQLLDLNNASVKSVACGEDFTAFLLNDKVGTVVILGNVLQFDVETSSEGNKVLKRGMYMSPAEKVVQIAAGFQHILILTSIGKIYAAGCGHHGRLGVNTIDDDELLSLESVVQQRTPHPVDFPCEDKAIVQISAGEKHSALITNTGEAYTWGCGTSGQLGNGVVKRYVAVPSKITLPHLTSQDLKGSRYMRNPNIKQAKQSMLGFAVSISCGSNHTILTMLDGSVATFGNNAYGQSGSTSTFYQTNKVEIVRQGLFSEGKRKVLLVGAGDCHSAALCDDSTLIMFGKASACGGNTIHAKKSKTRRNCLEPSKVVLQYPKTQLRRRMASW